MMPSEPSEPPKTDRKSIKAKEDAPPSSRKNSKSPGGSQAGKDKDKEKDKKKKDKDKKDKKEKDKKDKKEKDKDKEKDKKKKSSKKVTSPTKEETP